MNWGDWLVLLIVFIFAGIALRSIWKKRGKGCSGCAGCAKAGQCEKYDQENNNKK